MKAAILALSLSAAMTGAVVVTAAHGAQLSRTGVSSSLAVSDGKTLYLKNCRQCHGATGQPSAQSKKKYAKIKDFTDPDFFKTRSDDSLRVAVEKGVGRDMKGFGAKLSKEDIGAVVEYMHVLAKHK